MVTELGNKRPEEMTMPAEVLPGAEGRVFH